MLLVNILDRYGIPSDEEFGPGTNIYVGTIFVHQHDHRFLRKYLPLLYVVSKNGKIGNVEFIIDKSMFHMTGKSIYGHWGNEKRLTDTSEIRKRLREINIEY